MSVKDDIFPRDASEAYVQTQWSTGWGYAVIGFGEAARILTERQAQMHASVDQIGLAVFYLQRHRVELVIKHLLIDGLAQDPEKVIALRHNLGRLWVRLGEVVSGISPAQWQELDDEFGEFMTVMHEADAASFTYRYPADHQGRQVARAEYIDLRALEHHAERFEAGIMGYATWLEDFGSHGSTGDTG
jgi:hypothetical protein